MKRALLYARVSTADKGQDSHAQIEELRRVAKQRSWEIVAEVEDHATGSNTDRPGLKRARSRCRRGDVDIFAAVSVDRIARSLRDLLDLVDELETCGVKLACTREGDTDTTTPQGRAFLQARGIFAELELRIRSQQIREALQIRRERGQRLGRPRKLNYDLLARARELRAAGKSWTNVAAELGGKPGAWSRALSRAA